jgi:hypothetical protein
LEDLQLDWGSVEPEDEFGEVSELPSVGSCFVGIGRSSRSYVQVSFESSAWKYTKLKIEDGYLGLESGVVSAQRLVK